MPAFRASLSAAISAIGFGFLILPTTVHAYTPEQQQACSPDAMRLCGEFVPNVDAITACMIQKKAQLSPQCRAFFRQGPEPGEVADDRPVSRKPAKKSTSKPASTKKTTDSKKKKPK